MGRPKSVHGDLNRHLGQDLYGRLHIYPSLAAANADISTAEARLIYLADQKTVWYGTTGAWIQIAAGAGSQGVYPNPGSLPVGTIVAMGAVVGATSVTGDIVFAGPLAGLNISVGDFFVVTGSMDTASVAFLNGAYQVLSIDTLTNTVNVGPGAFPPPTLPVISWGTASAFIDAPPNGTMSVVSPDAGIGGGMAIWGFDAPANTWRRFTDEDLRLVLTDGSRPFTGFPQVTGVLQPLDDRDLTTKDYVDGVMTLHTGDTADPHAAAGYAKASDVSASFSAHIGDVGDPHAAAGYAKTAALPALISAEVDSTITSRELTTVANVNTLIGTHDTNPVAHGGVLARIDELMNTINSVNSTASTLVPVDLGAVPPANGIPLTMVNGVCVPITTEDEDVYGVLETYNTPTVIGTCTATGSAVDNTVTLNSGLIGANFIPGNGYSFPGISAVVLVIRRTEGNVLYMEGAVPTVGPVAGITVTEHPGSSVVLFGILQIPVAESHLTAADIVSITRSRPAATIAWIIEVGTAWSISTVKLGDQLIVSGHTGSPFRNGTYTVGYLDIPNRVIGFVGTNVIVVPAQTAAVAGAARTLIFPVAVSMTRLYPGMDLVISGSGLGNNGTFQIASIDPLFRTIVLAAGATLTTEAAVTVTVTDPYAMPVDSPDYQLTQDLVGGLSDNIIEVNGTTGVISVTKDSLPFALAARVLAVAGLDPLNPNTTFPITVVDTTLPDRDRVTVTGMTALLTRPIGTWGIASVVGWDTTNLADIYVDDGGRAKIIFTNAVLGSILPGDRIQIAGSLTADGIYTIDTVDSPTQLHLTTTAPGTDDLATAASAIITRDAIPNGAIAVNYLGATTAFDATTPANPKPFYVDLTDAQLVSATGLGTQIGHQLDKYRVLINPVQRATYNNKHVVFADSPFVPSLTHEVIVVDATGGVVVINLPAITALLSGKMYYFKARAVGINSVTINCDGANDIDGAPSKSLAVQYAHLTLEAVFVPAGTSYWNVL